MQIETAAIKYYTEYVISVYCACMHCKYLPYMHNNYYVKFSKNTQ